MSSSEESEDDFESAESDEESSSSDDTNSSASRPNLDSENSKFIEEPSNTEVASSSSEISLAPPIKSQSEKEPLRITEGLNNNEDLTAGTSANQTNNDVPDLSVTLDMDLVIPGPKLEHSSMKVDVLDISNSPSKHLDNLKKQSEIESEESKTESTSPLLEQQVSDLRSTTGSENETTFTNKISTRSVSSSSRGRSKVNKPSSLGAKKLGAVKLSPESSSDAVAATFGKLELTAVDPVPSTVASSSTIESRHQVIEVPPKPTQNQSGGWGWFVQPTSLLSSVSSLTNQILSTVENGLNIPEPEDLAKEEVLLGGKVQEEKEIELREEDSKTTGFSQLMGGMGNLTRFVESTGSSFFSTGLDTLESLGKKTINVLQQTDPGLKRTKAALINPLQVSQDRPCLSQVLREAREAKEIEDLMDATDPATSKSNQSSTPTLAEFFENHHGLVHLEALEMLSQQYQARVVPQIRRLTTQRKNIVEEVAKLCSFDSDSLEEKDNSDDFDLELLEQSLVAHFDRINLSVTLKKLIESFRRGFDSDNADGSVSDVKEIYLRSLDSLASVTSACVELMHKSSEMLLMSPKSTNPSINGRLEAETFSNVTKLLCCEIVKLGSYYANQIIKAETSGHTTNYSTDIFYEVSTCSSYLQNALKLSIPILQSRFF